MVDYVVMTALLCVIIVAGVRSVGIEASRNYQCIGETLNGIPCENTGSRGDG